MRGVADRLEVGPEGGTKGVSGHEEHGDSDEELVRATLGVTLLALAAGGCTSKHAAATGVAVGGGMILAGLTTTAIGVGVGSSEATMGGVGLATLGNFVAWPSAASYMAQDAQGSARSSGPDAAEIDARIAAALDRRARAGSVGAGVESVDGPSDAPVDEPAPVEPEEVVPVGAVNFVGDRTVPRDTRLTARACDGGDSGACWRLGNMAVYGIGGMEVTDGEACAFLEYACEVRDHAQVCQLWSDTCTFFPPETP